MPICGADYLGANARAVGICLSSCNTCRFSATDCLGSTIVLNPYFNPEGGFYDPQDPDQLPSSTLVVCGPASSITGLVLDVLWANVGAGRSFGDGFKAQQNATEAGPGLALLGDGTLRGGVVKWNGGEDTHWSVEQNWLDPDEVPRRPEPPDYVRISSAAVTFDLDPFVIHDIWSLDLRDGASVEMQENTRLFLVGALLSTPREDPPAPPRLGCSLSVKSSSTGGRRRKRPRSSAACVSSCWTPRAA